MADTYTDFPLNDPLAVQRFSNSLAVQGDTKQYFKRFMGTGDDALIKIARDLQKKSGESIKVGLRTKLSGKGVDGDNIIEKTDAEEGLSFFHDQLYVDQRRKSTKSKGKMSEQRVPYGIRVEGRNALSTWHAEDYDQQIMMALAGARGVNSDFFENTSFTGRANNKLIAPDSTHMVYAGDATGKADMSASDTPKVLDIEKLAAIVKKDTYFRPINVDGQKKMVFLMHPFHTFAFRTEFSKGDWADIRSSVDSSGKSPLFSGALGEYAGIVLHEHPYVIEFSDYGSGKDLKAARGLFLGAHAGMIAWGGESKYGRYSWNEETEDRGNRLVITSGTIYGTKRSIYNGKSLGCYAVDAAIKDPTD